MDSLSFYVTDRTLKSNKFKAETHYDKARPFDKHNTLRFEYYTRKINKLLSISVNYTFEADKNDSNKFKLVSSVVQLHINDSFAPIAVKTMSDILNLIKLISNDR